MAGGDEGTTEPDQLTDKAYDGAMKPVTSADDLLPRMRLFAAVGGLLAVAGFVLVAVSMSTGQLLTEVLAVAAFAGCGIAAHRGFRVVPDFFPED